jgi:hypothetical protein
VVTSLTGLEVADPEDPSRMVFEKVITANKRIETLINECKKYHPNTLGCIIRKHGNMAASMTKNRDLKARGGVYLPGEIGEVFHEVFCKGMTTSIITKLDRLLDAMTININTTYVKLTDDIKKAKIPAIMADRAAVAILKTEAKTMGLIVLRIDTARAKVQEADRLMRDADSMRTGWVADELVKLTPKITMSTGRTARNRIIAQLLSVLVEDKNTGVVNALQAKGLTTFADIVGQLKKDVGNDLDTSTEQMKSWAAKHKVQRPTMTEEKEAVYEQIKNVLEDNMDVISRAESLRDSTFL